MSMKYIRKAYNVPAKRGMKIRFSNSEGQIDYGVIVGSVRQYLRVRVDGRKPIATMHPTWRIEYLPEGPR